MNFLEQQRINDMEYLNKFFEEQRRRAGVITVYENVQRINELADDTCVFFVYNNTLH